MRSTMDKGAGRHRFCTRAEDGRNSHCLHFTGQPLPQAQVLYALLGANLQAKISCSAAPLKMRWRIRPSLQRPIVTGAFILSYIRPGLTSYQATAVVAKLFTPSRWVPSRDKRYLWRLYASRGSIEPGDIPTPLIRRNITVNAPAPD